MNPEEKEMLEEALELAEENNKILRKLQSSARWARFFRILYWAVIIGLSIWAYYYLQPLLQQLLEAYAGVKEGIDSLGNLINFQQ
jgi:hypothetical protein